MTAIAGLGGQNFGTKDCLELVLCGERHDGFPCQYDMIAHDHGVVGILQDDFELAGSRFGVNLRHGNVLLLELCVQVSEEGFLLVECRRVGKDRVINGSAGGRIIQTKLQFHADVLENE